MLSKSLFLSDKYEHDSFPSCRKVLHVFLRVLVWIPHNTVNRNITLGFLSSSLQVNKVVYTWHLWQKSLAFPFTYMKRQPLLPAAVLTSVQVYSIKSTREQCLIYNNSPVLSRWTCKWSHGTFLPRTSTAPGRMWWVNSHVDINNGMSQRQTVNEKKTLL